MKKVLALMLVLIMVLSLAACGGDKGPTPSGGTTDPGTSQQEQPSNPPDNSEDSQTPSGGSTDEPKSGDPEMDKRLDMAGLTFESIEPEQEYESSGFEKLTIRFYFAKGVVAETGAYYHQVIDACKAVSDDGKVYETENGVYNGKGDEAEFVPQAAEKYEELSATLAIGYKKDGKPVTVKVTPSLEDNGAIAYWILISNQTSN